MARRPSPAPSLAALGILLCALAAWMLVPRADAGKAPERDPLRVVLVDASASVVRPRVGWRSWARSELEREASEAAAAGEELLVLRFAADVERIYGPDPAQEFLEQLARSPWSAGPSESGLETRLASALAIAERALAEVPGGRVSVLGDRWATGDDPGPGLARLAGRGIQVTRLAPPSVTRSDLALESLSLPQTIEPGAPLVVTCAFSWLPANGSESLALALDIQDADGARARLEPILPPPVARGAVPDDAPGSQADGRVRWRSSFDLGPAASGTTFVRARAVLGDGRGDAFPENDRRAGRTDAAGRRVVLLSGPPYARRHAEGWLRPLEDDGLQLVWVDPDGIAEELPHADVLVTLDLSPERAPPSVEPFVLQGGGWLACSGGRLLAGWSDHERGPAALLPLVPDPGQQEPRDVTFLVDGSGSMEGEPFERVRRALAELIDVALPEDRVELVFFTGSVSPPVELTRGTGPASLAERRAALEALMAARVPGGTTAILYSLEELARQRARRSAQGRTGIVFLLSDGRDVQAFDTENRAHTLIDQLAAARTRLAVVAIGSEADTEFLGKLVAPDDQLLIEGEWGDLSALFQRELHRERRTCGEGLRLFSAPAVDGTMAIELQRAILAGTGADDAAAFGPPLECWVRTVALPSAELLWVGPEGEPVAAIQRVGLGATAFFASAPLPGWAPAWTSSAPLFAPLVRTLARGSRRLEQERPSVRWVADRLVVEGLGESRTLVPAELVDRDGERREVLELSARIAPATLGAGESVAFAYEAHADRWTGTGAELLLEDGQRLRVPARPEPELASQQPWNPVPAGPAAREAATAAGADARAPWILAGGLVALALAVVLGLGRPARRF